MLKHILTLFVEWITHFSCWFLAALQALKRKKRYEQQLAQIDGTMLTIEQQREALEGANTNTAVLTTMKTAADALKSAHQNMYVPLYIIIHSCRYLFGFKCKLESILYIQKFINHNVKTKYFLVCFLYIIDFFFIYIYLSLLFL